MAGKLATLNILLEAALASSLDMGGGIDVSAQLLHPIPDKDSASITPGLTCVGYQSYHFIQIIN